jgi:chromosome segregation ATPase
MSNDEVVPDADLAIADSAIHSLRAEIENLKADINMLKDALRIYAEQSKRLLSLIEERDCEIAELKRENETVSKIAANFEDMLAKSDRKPEVLEDNLDLARSEHLQQLREIVQMLKLIKTDEFEHGNDYTVGALKLAIAVIQNNINKLEWLLN